MNLINNIQSNIKMKKIIVVVLLGLFNVVYSQTNSTNLNSQLEMMRKYFLEKKYNEFLNFTYPKVVEMMGGREKSIKATKASIEKMEKEGYTFVNIKFKNPSKFIKKGTETQFTITQELLMKTPKGNILAEYTMIGISNDNGKNWKFIDTSGKSKEVMRKYFPNLSPDIVIKTKTQKLVD